MMLKQETQLYRRYITFDVPLRYPAYAIQITVTQEANGFAVWKQVWTDGEMADGGDRPLFWLEGREEALDIGCAQAAATQARAAEQAAKTQAERDKERESA